MQDIRFDTKIDEAHQGRYQNLIQGIPKIDVEANRRVKNKLEAIRTAKKKQRKRTKKGIYVILDKKIRKLPKFSLEASENFEN